MTERMFKGDGPLAVAERDAEVAERQRSRDEAEAELRRKRAESNARNARDHSVTVTTRLDDEGTEDERRRVDTVRFTCTAAPDAECRTYPKCDCESWHWDEGGTHDQNGHERVSGQECWLTGWFDNEGACYVGDDGDDMRDDYIPAIDRSGPITNVLFCEDYIEWDWAAAYRVGEER